MKGDIENARKLQKEADIAKEPKEKIRLYMSSAKEYLKAAQIVTDKTVQVTLMYLSNANVHTAHTILNMTQNMPTDSQLQQEQINKTLGKANISGPISDVSESMYAKRLMFKAHQSRLTNINKVSYLSQSHTLK